MKLKMIINEEKLANLMALESNRIDDKIEYVVTGNTYAIKDQIKAAGGKWQSSIKKWTISPDAGFEVKKIYWFNNEKFKMSQVLQILEASLDGEIVQNEVEKNDKMHKDANMTYTDEYMTKYILTNCCDVFDSIVCTKDGEWIAPETAYAHKVIKGMFEKGAFIIVREIPENPEKVKKENTKSDIFRAAHAMAKELKKNDQSIDYRAQFAVCLKYVMKLITSDKTQNITNIVKNMIDNWNFVA